MPTRHATFGSGTESGDGSVSKTAWEEDHDGTNDHDHSGGADTGGALDHDDMTNVTATQHHTNANDPSAGEKAALAGTSGTPGSGNKYVTDGDARNTNSRTPTAHATSH